MDFDIDIYIYIHFENKFVEFLYYLNYETYLTKNNIFVFPLLKADFHFH